MIVCPTCKAENEPQGPLGRYCVKCGSRLPMAAADPSSPSSNPALLTSAKPSAAPMASKSPAPAAATASGAFWRSIALAGVSIIVIAAVASLFKSNNMDFRLMFIWLFILIGMVATVARHRPGPVSAVVAGFLVAVCFVLGILAYYFTRTIKDIDAKAVRLFLRGTGMLMMLFLVTAVVARLVRPKSPSEKTD